MSLISAKGSDIDLSGGVDLKTVFIRLKENEAVKVRVLGVSDYIEYKAHSDYNNKVYTQPCVAPLGDMCPMCVAGKSGIEEFKNLYPRKRYLFAFGDMATGAIRVWDCSYPQAKDMLGQIKEYADNIGDIAFNLKRTGQKKDTSYKLNPIIKMTAADKENFEVFEGTTVEMSFFESVIVPRTEALMLSVLDDAGFPMAKFFPDYVREADAAGVVDAPTADTTPPVETGDLPF